MPPAEGTTFRGDRVVLVDGQLMMERTRRPIEPKDFDTATFAPAAVQVGGALPFIARASPFQLLLHTWDQADRAGGERYGEGASESGKVLAAWPGAPDRGG